MLVACPCSCSSGCYCSLVKLVILEVSVILKSHMTSVSPSVSPSVDMEYVSCEVDVCWASVNWPCRSVYCVCLSVHDLTADQTLKSLLLSVVKIGAGYPECSYC